MTADADGARMSKGFSRACMARCSNKMVYSSCGSLFILVLCLSGEMEEYLEWCQMSSWERPRERGIDNQPEQEQLDWDKN